MARTQEVKASRHLWGKTGQGRSVWDAALDRTRYIYDHFDHVFVWFSGGKDSTATLHVALEVAAERGALPLRVVFVDEECITNETVDYVRRVARRDDVTLEWYCLPVRHRNACSTEHPNWWPWAPEDEAKWVRPLPPEAITTLERFVIEPPEMRLTIPELSPLVCDPALKNCGLLGIRAQESMVRRAAISNNRPDNWIMNGGARWYYKGYPIYDWTTADVWTAPAKMGWDYNASYDVMEMFGLTHYQQRCAPPFGEEPMQQLPMWAACFPDIWARMSERVPGSATAARYAKTELYGNTVDGVPDPPPGVTWEQHIANRIAQHPPEMRSFIAQSIQHRIRRHYRKTTDPIMPTARHPMSAMSWKYLWQIAEIGDLKGRRGAREVIAPGPAFERAREAYDRERAIVEGVQDGRH